MESERLVVSGWDPLVRLSSSTFWSVSADRRTASNLRMVGAAGSSKWNRFIKAEVPRDKAVGRVVINGFKSERAGGGHASNSSFLPYFIQTFLIYVQVSGTARRRAGRPNGRRAESFTVPRHVHFLYLLIGDPEEQRALLQMLGISN